MSIDKQFFFGPSLMVSPVLNSTNKVDMYFPPGKWYDWFTQDVVVDTPEGVNKTLTVPMDTIPLHILGGHIVITEEPGMTTNDCRQGTFSIIVALDRNSGAEGRVYIDDGITLDSMEFLYISYVATPGSTDNSFVVAATAMKGSKEVFNFDIPKLAELIILGVVLPPKSIKFNGKELDKADYKLYYGKLIVHLSKTSMYDNWRFEYKPNSKPL